MPAGREATAAGVDAMLPAGQDQRHSSRGSSTINRGTDGMVTSSSVQAKWQLLDATPQAFQQGWPAAKMDISTLELDNTKAK